MRDEEKRPVLTVEEALEHILSTVHVLEPQQAPLLAATGRVLAETVVADRDIPPAANSAMDGFAVRWEDIRTVPARLRVVGQVATGHVPDQSVGPGEALRIITGAPLPNGADTVVRFEDTHPLAEWIEVLRAPQAGANVRAAGEDVQAGQVVLEPGKALRPQEIGMLAAIGHTEVSVVRRPRVAILATGDEVVDPSEAPGPGQIRDANSYTVAAQVQRYGGIPIILGIAHDEAATVQRGMKRALEAEADLIITSGGVSVGDFDLVKQVLAAEGQMHFWSLNMKPGRPLAFGVLNGIPLLGLPGNPVAAMISTELFGRPAILKMQGFRDWSARVVQAQLAQAIEHKDRRRHYLRARLSTTEAGYQATLTGDQGSGILNSLVQADGLVIIPDDTGHVPAGRAVEVLLLE